jgi:hypothetical protein
MIRRKRLFTLVALLSASIFLNSCYKDRFNLDELAGGEWNPEVAAPIIKSRLTMDDVISKSVEEWRENPDGLLSLIYHQKSSTSLADEIVVIPDQSADTNFRVTLPSGMIPGDSTSKLFSFFAQVTGSNGELIDDVFFKSGYLDFEVTTNLNHNAKIQIIIPSLTKYGVTFYQSIEIPSSGGATHTVKVSFPIGLYKAVFNHPNGTDNQIEEFMKVYVNFGVASNNSPYSLKISQGLRDLSYYNASGYFGQHDFFIDKEVLGISLFDNSVIDQIFLEDPKLHLNFYNSFGFPINVTMEEFYVEKNGLTMNFVSTNLPTFGILAATKMYEFDTTRITFDKANSNIVDIFNFQPKKIAFKEKLTANPLGIPQPNFLFDTSKVYIDAEVELPLYGRTLNFTLRDSSDINVERQAGVISAELRFNLGNEFPVDANVQLYLADSNSIIIDTLLSGTDMILMSAPVGPAPDYRTSTIANKTTVVVLKGDKLENLWKAKKIIFSANLSTADQGSKVVKIYSDYGIDIRVAVKLNYLTEI